MRAACVQAPSPATIVAAKPAAFHRVEARASTGAVVVDFTVVAEGMAAVGVISRGLYKL